MQYDAGDDAVALITLNRPERLNALADGMVERYAGALHRADDDPAVRAVVVTGAGRGFCSGADLSLLQAGSQALSGFSDRRAGPTVAAATALGVPVVAAVNGPAAGLGTVLALLCDVRMAARSARLSTTFARLGLVAEYGVSWVLPRLVGLPAATELLLSGRTVDADEALALGLVTSVHDDGDLLPAARAYAAGLAAHSSPRSMATMKAQLYGDASRTLAESVARSQDLMAESFTWPDLPEAVAAHADGRPPRFAPLRGTPASQDPSDDLPPGAPAAP